MAEGFVEDFLSLIHATDLVHQVLRDAYQALPLPIVLPEYDSSDGIEQAHRILIEAADRIADLPVDGLAGQFLFEATYHWISATAVMRLYATFRYASYSLNAKWNATKAYDEAEIALQMLRQQD